MSVQSALSFAVYPVVIGDHCIAVRSGEPILAAARRAGLWLPFECGWGSCGTCRATLLEGSVHYLFPAAPARRPLDERRRRILLCQTTPAGPVKLKPLSVSFEPPPDLPTADYRGLLLQCQEIGPDLFHLTVKLDRPAIFLPGQYAIVQLDSGVRRCYSMTNLPGEGTVTFLVRRQPGGVASPLLTQLPLGSPVHVELPYGRAYLRNSGRPLVLLAGGTGIAPMLSILRALAFQHQGDCPPVTLFYGARNVASLVELATIRELLGRLPQAALHLSISDPDPNWDGPICSVLELFEQWTTDWPSYDYYLCGPPALVDGARRLLLERSVPITQIHADPFG